jgi:DNA-binding beta-propeller fold protein YncE
MVGQWVRWCGFEVERKGACKMDRKIGVWIAAAVVGMCVLPAGARPDELLVTSFWSDSVGRYSASSGAFNGTLDSASGIDGPLCTRIGPDGLLYVASEATNSIERFDVVTGNHLGRFVTSGAGGLNGPTSLDWDASGNLYVSSFNSDSVLKFDGTSGAFVSTFVTAGLGGLNGPDNGSIFGPDGHLYVPSYYTNRILRYDGTTGAFLGAFVTSVVRPRVLLFVDNVLLVTSENADSVRKFDASTGAALGNFVAPGAGGLDVPVGMAFGPDGNLYVSSSANDRVLRYNGTTGAFMDVFLDAGAGGMDGPVFLTFIPAPSSILVIAGGLGIAARRRR